MTYLPDVNVWLALASDRHQHHRRAADWFTQLNSSVAFCRVTQMGFLRLLTNKTVMKEETHTRDAAWQLYENFRSDRRVHYLEEPAELEQEWKRTSVATTSGSHWTDSYLLAFAIQSDVHLVTFDRKLAGKAGSGVFIH